MTTTTTYRFTQDMLDGIRAYDRDAIAHAQRRAPIAKTKNARVLNAALTACESALMAAGWQDIHAYLAYVDAPVTVDAPVKASKWSDPRNTPELRKAALAAARVIDPTATMSAPLYKRIRRAMVAAA